MEAKPDFAEKERLTLVYKGRILKDE